MRSSAMTGERVLVTGGAGFIGSHLVDALLAEGADVRVLDNFSTGRRRNLLHCSGRIDLREGDIRDIAVCRSAAEGMSFVFHQAALGSVPRSVEDPATTIAVNVSGTANVFGAARDAHVGRVIYASSSSVYGASEKLPKREGEEGAPLSPYALSKSMSERLAEVFATCYGMDFSGLRYFNVYGPRQDPDGPYAAVIPRLFRACTTGQAPTIYGDGEQSRDFTYVSDVVSANLLAAKASGLRRARTYNVAGGTAATINRLARLVREVVGEGENPVYGPPRVGDVRHSLADLSLSTIELGYVPRFTLEEGLAASREYYLSLVTESNSAA